MRTIIAWASAGILALGISACGSGQSNTDGSLPTAPGDDGGGDTRAVGIADPGGEWGIPELEIVDPGPGKDGIPSVDNPVYQDR